MQMAISKGIETNEVIINEHLNKVNLVHGLFTMSPCFEYTGITGQLNRITVLKIGCPPEWIRVGKKRVSKKDTKPIYSRFNNEYHNAME